ncbi:hypothetical protein [Nocardioides plantarum]|uniref:Uncharacterized protein n=1 Tax=Nocardioides plantarum TaxID=29299 RepID=A0ABV5KEH5_9ACTN|nr:hypothetical protein [Nocardioides plantarum]
MSRSTAVVSGGVRDACPADGQEARLYASGAKNGTTSIGTPFMGDDANGCGTGYVSFEKTITVSGKLEWLMFRLQESDTCYAGVDCTNSYSDYENPYN